MHFVKKRLESFPCLGFHTEKFLRLGIFSLKNSLQALERIAPSQKYILTGSGVGMLALASPICAQAINPPFITISGFAPNSPGCHRTRSASLPTCQFPQVFAIRLSKLSTVQKFVPPILRVTAVHKNCNYIVYGIWVSRTLFTLNCLEA